MIFALEPNLDESFPSAQFHIENYQFLAFPNERNSSGGAKLVYVKQGISYCKIIRKL